MHEIMSSDEYKYKMKIRLKENKAYVGTSKEEQELFKAIQKKHPDCMIHYMSHEYPWLCDFYIPSLDLYIEYQGFPTHGGHPYDPNNQKDQIVAEQLKQKFKTNKVFTKTDPEKRAKAKENNLNYIEWWNIKEALDWIDKNL